jgi:hypothetical protein
MGWKGVDLDIQIADVNLLENLMGDLKSKEFEYQDLSKVLNP